MTSSLFNSLINISLNQSPNLYRLEQWQANGIPFNPEPRICRNRNERTVYPLNQTRFPKKLTDGKPNLTHVYPHILFLKNSESLQIILCLRVGKDFQNEILGRLWPRVWKIITVEVIEEGKTVINSPTDPVTRPYSLFRTK